MQHEKNHKVKYYEQLNSCDNLKPVENRKKLSTSAQICATFMFFHTIIAFTIYFMQFQYHQSRIDYLETRINDLNGEFLVYKPIFDQYSESPERQTRERRGISNHSEPNSKINETDSEPLTEDGVFLFNSKIPVYIFKKHLYYSI